jgi:CBS domain-containing protein
MKVEDILRHKGHRVATVAPDATVATVAQRLRSEGVGALVVSAGDDHIDGIISERDIVRGMAEHGADLLDMPAASVMTSTVETCTPSDTVQSLMQKMTERRIRHLPVVADGDLAGIISIGDVVKNRLQEMQDEAEQLRDYIYSPR